MRILWRDDVATFHGRHFNFDKVLLDTKPAQAEGVPIVIGGSSEFAADGAGLRGDGFLPCAERDHRLFEGSRYVLARRSGHNTAEWRPDAFVPTVTEFIADVEAGREVAGEFVL